MLTVPTRCITNDSSLDAFLTHLEGNNASPQTRSAYRSDLTQFLAFLASNNAIIVAPDQVERVDIDEWLADLAHRGCSGVTRARKLAAIRGYFSFLIDAERS